MCKQIYCLLNGLLHCLCSYVFDGKPPDMKKQELAKRHDIFEFLFHPLILPVLFDTLI
jgi:hypothetical protein